MQNEIKVLIRFCAIRENRLFLVSSNPQNYQLPQIYLEFGQAMEPFFINYAQNKYGLSLVSPEMILVDEKIMPDKHEIQIVFRSRLSEEPKDPPIELCALSIEEIKHSSARFVPNKSLLLSIAEV